MIDNNEKNYSNILNTEKVIFTVRANTFLPIKGYDFSNFLLLHTS